MHFSVDNVQACQGPYCTRYCQQAMAQGMRQTSFCSEVHPRCAFCSDEQLSPFSPFAQLEVMQGKALLLS